MFPIRILIRFIFGSPTQFTEKSPPSGSGANIVNSTIRKLPPSAKQDEIEPDQVGRLREDFEAWAQRDLGELKIRYLFLDGRYPWVRIGKNRARVPVLVTLGVCSNGQRVVLDLRLAGGESEQPWLEAVRSLSARHLGTPVLVIDGNPGLAAALKMQWPQLAIQRCTNHKIMESAGQGPGPSARGTGRGLSAHDLCP